jgi:Tol biopolymer transport system component
VSVGSHGEQAADHGGWNVLSLSLSSDGRYVGFTSTAPNFSPGDDNAQSDGFVRDRLTATTRSLVPSMPLGGTAHSGQPVFSADGRLVVYEAQTREPPGGVSSASLYAMDPRTGDTRRLDPSPWPLSSAGGVDLSVSADGRFIAYDTAPWVRPPPSMGDEQVWVYDRGPACPDGSFMDGPVWSAAGDLAQSASAAAPSAHARVCRRTRAARALSTAGI